MYCVFKMKRFTINANDAGQRVDKFITKACPNMPLSMLYKAVRKKDVKLNRRRCDISARLCEGDVLEIYLPDDVFAKDSRDISRVSGDIRAVYEDENIILADKPVGLAVHEDESSTADTLANRVKAYLIQKGEYDPERENSFAPALCNRLDRNTCGIVIAAKNAEALRIMNEKIRSRQVHKQYLCIVLGTPEPREAVLHHYLFKNSKTNTVTVQEKKTRENREIITGYKVLKTNGELSIAEIDLMTGRTHQIRAHMAYIGHPLLGDGKYGDNRINRSYGIKTQALCAYKLRLDFTGEKTALDYLSGREFTVDDVWFEDKFL